MLQNNNASTITEMRGINRSLTVLCASSSGLINFGMGGGPMGEPFEKLH